MSISFNEALVQLETLTKNGRKPTRDELRSLVEAWGSGLAKQHSPTYFST